MINLQDKHGRIKRKLRVSLTDRCNLRCPYCMPEHPEWLPKAQLLDNDELKRLLRLFIGELGITQLRLTGGEPLLRPDLEQFIVALQVLRENGLQRISLTTNGLLLQQRAQALKAAGLDDLNVSLDTLDPAHFTRLSGGRGSLQQVLDGIVAAKAIDLPLKLNCVVIRGYNEDDILPLAHWAYEQNLPLRFIEFMPLDGRGSWSPERVVSEAEILQVLARDFRVEPQPRSHEPATYHLLNGRYQLGVISTISQPFCASCDRLRLTADGELYSCLFSAKGRDLRTPLRADATDEELLQIVRGHVWHKERGYATQPGYVARPLTMHALGG
ncbi:MAG: GTP 3',8-cyclase MoaA [Nevskiales bacterium]